MVEWITWDLKIPRDVACAKLHATPSIFMCVLHVQSCMLRRVYSCVSCMCKAACYSFWALPPWQIEVHAVLLSFLSTRKHSRVCKCKVLHTNCTARHTQSVLSKPNNSWNSRWWSSCHLCPPAQQTDRHTEAWVWSNGRQNGAQRVLQLANTYLNVGHACACAFRINTIVYTWAALQEKHFKFIALS